MVSIEPRGRGWRNTEKGAPPGMSHQSMGESSERSSMAEVERILAQLREEAAVRGLSGSRRLEVRHL